MTSVGRTSLVLVMWTGALCAQEAKNDPYAGLSAADAMHRGNQLLKQGQPQASLEAYSHARKLAPTAPEISFAEGLAHYAMQDFGKARESFMHAANAKDTALRNDALYSLATCDHAEALKEGQEPRLALSMLEAAMQQYHDILSRDSKHEAARDANSKAAAKWRELKQLLQQQPPPQQQQQGDKNEQKDQQDGQQQPQEGQQEQEKQSDQQNESQDRQQEAGQQRQEEEKEGGQEEQQSKQEPQQPSDRSDEAPTASEQKDEATREQAQRRLREMMHAVQQRKKAKPERVQHVAPVPVDKDW